MLNKNNFRVWELACKELSRQAICAIAISETKTMATDGRIFVEISSVNADIK